MPYTDDSLDTAQFAAGLLNPDASNPDHVTGPNGKGAIKRYNVYRNNVTVSLVNALADIFPAVQKIVGEGFFRAMAREHVRAHPPVSPLLFRYGEDFAAFIDAFPPAAPMPYLGDVARVERGWLTAYHAADAAPADPAGLAAIAPEQLADVRFESHPATFLLRSDYPVHDIVLMNRDLAPLQPVDMTRTQSVLLTRPHDEVRMVALDEATHAFMTAILAGQSLGGAAVAGQQTDDTFNLNEALMMMLATGATCRIVPPTEGN